MKHGGPQRPRAIGPLLIVWIASAAACAGPRYHLAPLPQDWRRVRTDGDSAAFHHAGGGTIAVDVTCGEEDDVPLHVLTNHLLFGFEQRREQSRRTLPLDGRAALRTRIDGTLDGVPVALDLVVLKKDGCTYDLILIARPDEIAQRQPDFDRFLAGFAQVTRQAVRP